MFQVFRLRKIQDCNNSIYLFIYLFYLFIIIFFAEEKSVFSIILNAERFLMYGELNTGFNLTNRDSYFTILVEVFKNHISAEKTLIEID